VVARILRIVVLGTLLLAGACSALPRSYPLPDRSSAATQAEEARLAGILEEPGVIVTSGAKCEVRLLGRDRETSYAWAHCEGDHDEGASLAVRVEGTEVLLPGMGNQYEEGVRRLFPDGLEDRILADPESLRP
jgi:hypothetical protein